MTLSLFVFVLHGAASLEQSRGCFCCSLTSPWPRQAQRLPVPRYISQAMGTAPARVVRSHIWSSPDPNCLVRALWSERTSPQGSTRSVQKLLYSGIGVQKSCGAGTVATSYTRRSCSLALALEPEAALYGSMVFVRCVESSLSSICAQSTANSRADCDVYIHTRANEPAREGPVTNIIIKCSLVRIEDTLSVSVVYSSLEHQTSLQHPAPDPTPLPNYSAQLQRCCSEEKFSRRSSSE